ncbi:MAG: hypothetical protein HOP29_15620 [Phycisphaerales bacterium]|nr:hypothetical protein [Phycisphaerales bacterium]
MRRVVVMGGIAVWLAGCGRPVGPLFDPAQGGPVWPEPPAEARIRYVGELRTSADLKAPPKPFEQLGDLLAGKRAAESMYGPRDVVCTPDGRYLWVADPGGRCVHWFDLAAREYQRITRAGDAPLLTPVGLALGPDGGVYVCDSEEPAIHRFAADTGRWIESPRLPDEVRRPVGMVFDEVHGELFVVDASAHQVIVLSRDGSLVRTIGDRGSGPGKFNYPSAIAPDGEGLWIADSGNQRVQRVTRDGTPILSIGQAGDAPGDLALPKGVACDRDGNVYVVDGRFENVQVFDREGRLLLVFGEEGTGPGAFWLPGGVFIDGQDRIWICDAYNGRVQVFQRVGIGAADDGIGP